MKKTILLILLAFSFIALTYAQSGFVSYGGTATGAGGSTNVSVGQWVFYDYGTGVTIAEGLQQSYESSNPLPVELLEFTANALEQSVVLNWKTASELNNDYFEIQRSADAINFETIGSQTGNGTTNILNSYSYIDNAPLSGISYYRLKQVDDDGVYEYSPIKSVLFDETSDLQINAWVNESKILNIHFDKALEQESQADLVDMHGRYIGSFNIAYNQTDVQYNVSHLSPAVYVLRIRSLSTLYVKKFVIHN